MHKIIHSDCLDAMRKMEDNSIDFIVTDPPYGLHFMGKTWDKFKKSNFDEKGDYKYLKNASVDGRNCKVRKIGSANHESGGYDPKRDDEFQEFMRCVGVEMLRIIKPGGHIAMFGSPRRHHRQISGLEDAGFEIRDCIPWIFGQGFPKSHNFGRKLGDGWKGYGTALKPAYEPIIIAMKPLDGTFAQNAEKWGVGGVNIDDSRIGIDKIKTCEKLKGSSFSHLGNGEGFNGCPESFHTGRWPANIIFDEEAAQELDVMTGNNVSRFFYCAKASSSERNKGLEGMPDGQITDGRKAVCDGPYLRKETIRKNTHPTVKPISLMKYIITLLSPPYNPTCLDPFMGSGSTGVACRELGINFIGIEKEKEYVEIAEKRINKSETIIQLSLM